MKDRRVSSRTGQDVKLATHFDLRKDDDLDLVIAQTGPAAAITGVLRADLVRRNMDPATVLLQRVGLQNLECLELGVVMQFVLAP